MRRKEERKVRNQKRQKTLEDKKKRKESHNGGHCTNTSFKRRFCLWTLYSTARSLQVEEVRGERLHITG